MHDTYGCLERDEKQPKYLGVILKKEHLINIANKMQFYAAMNSVGLRFQQAGSRNVC